MSCIENSAECNRRFFEKFSCICFTPSVIVGACESDSTGAQEYLNLKMKVYRIGLVQASLIDTLSLSTASCKAPVENGFVVGPRVAFKPKIDA